ncbi:hypothetical protein N836_31835 [Leptolyngbya sp. Heron Island J]|uniref:hypothetical protein n=1 Tax=Leptolyngbya sp. Heron Island J TaxID=1385935 RepID=UPI0003B9D3BF|nr:hypothetical protein [Leptolyngbya sp. Heron Island J]ESA38531.1 hypothetical protein N836_31835 [Leptolyngbya sp. Heron Island J]
MPPVFLVSLPFILLLLLSRGMNTQSAQPKSAQPTIEKVIDIIDSQDGDEIIIVRQKKRS